MVDRTFVYGGKDDWGYWVYMIVAHEKLYKTVYKNVFQQIILSKIENHNGQWLILFWVYSHLSVNWLEFIQSLMKTSKARLKTRSALSCGNFASKLSANYLYIQFQKSTKEHSRCVVRLSSSKRFNSIFWAREGRICRTVMSKDGRKYIFDPSANYLFLIFILFIAHSPISLLTRLSNHSNWPRTPIPCPWLSLIKLCRDHYSSNNQFIIKNWIIYLN